VNMSSLMFLKVTHNLTLDPPSLEMLTMPHPVLVIMQLLKTTTSGMWLFSIAFMSLWSLWSLCFAFKS
jgi:hypothetical protein